MIKESLPVTNVRVNYDPANILLYNNGDPIEVIDILAKHIEQCHLKDATRTKVPGTWGAEVAVGTGEVNWPQFFEHLKKNGFNVSEVTLWETASACASYRESV